MATPLPLQCVGLKVSIYYNSLMIPTVVAPKRTLWFCGPFGGQRTTTEKLKTLSLDATHRLFAFYIFENAQFDFYKLQVSFFAVRRLRFFCYPHPRTKL